MDLSDLYQQLILDHNAKPHHFGELTDANHKAQGYNPLCGDELKLTLKINDANVIVDVAFTGSGCAISKASASIMTDCIKGKSVQEVEHLFDIFHTMLTTENDAKDAPPKLQAFSGVREFPARVKCATLAWHTLKAAIHNEQQATTE